VRRFPIETECRVFIGAAALSWLRLHREHRPHLHRRCDTDRKTLGRKSLTERYRDTDCTSSNRRSDGRFGNGDSAGDRRADCGQIARG
jgi:hypothetical protein